MKNWSEKETEMLKKKQEIRKQFKRFKKKIKKKLIKNLKKKEITRKCLN